MKRITITAIISTLFIAHADAASNFYMTGAIGAVFPSSSSSFTKDSTSILYSPTTPGVSLFTLPNVNWKNTFNTGFNLSLASGYQFTPNWRSDVEFLYQQMQREVKGSYDWREVNSATGNLYASSLNNTISHKSANTNVYSFLTNAYYDFKNSSKWTPTMGVGIGVSWISSPRTTANNVLTVDDPSTPLVETAPVLQLSPALYGTAFTWQFKAAVSYEVSDKTSVFVQYRLFGMTHVEAKTSSITSNPGVAGQSIFTVGQHDVSGLLTNILELGVHWNV